MPSAEQLEGLAEDILDKHGTLPPVDALVLADGYGLIVTPTGPYDEGFSGGEVRFNCRANHRDYHEFVAKCIAREALSRKRIYACHATIGRLARAIMLPRTSFNSQADFATLLREHPHASVAMIGARKGDMFEARQRRLRPVTAYLDEFARATRSSRG